MMIGDGRDPENFVSLFSRNSCGKSTCLLNVIPIPFHIIDLHPKTKESSFRQCVIYGDDFCDITENDRMRALKRGILIDSENSNCAILRGHLSKAELSYNMI